jgi:hypothetical protein
LRDSSREIVDFGRRIARAMAPIEWPRTFQQTNLFSFVI